MTQQLLPPKITEKSELDKVASIKSRVLAMLAERHALNARISGSATASPSPSAYWSDFCSYFEYLLGLADEYYSQIRWHTWHLTSDNYMLYYYGDPAQFREALNLEVLLAGVPERYHLKEPTGGIGFHYADAGFLSLDIVRMQRVICTLYRHRVFDELAQINGRRAYALEIGAGFGNLGHNLANFIPNLTYCIVDLPETLLFSATYLALHNPEKKVYVYHQDDFAAVLQSGAINHYDFVLLPNYQLEALSHLKFDVASNVASFQEMRSDQVATYLDFIKVHCQGALYSWNEDRQPRNAEMSSVTTLLQHRFDLHDTTEENLFFKSRPTRRHALPLRSKVKDMVKRGAADLRLMQPAVPSVRRYPMYTLPDYKEYICRPLNTPSHHQS